MIEFTAVGTDTVIVIRDNVKIGKIQRIKHVTPAETTIRWDARIDNHHFNDKALCVVKRQIHDVLPDHNDRQVRVNAAGLTALEQAKLIFEAATKIKAS